jgi:hypothetical protein
MTTNTATTRPTVVRLALETPADEARDQLICAGEAVAFVSDGTDDVGVITVEEITDAAIENPSGPVSRVLRHELVSIDPACGDMSTLSTYRHAAWRSLRRRGPGRSPAGKH